MNTLHMITHPKQQDVDLWEAWIDLQSTDSGNRFTLYVVGDVFTDDAVTQPYFTKRRGGDPGTLALEIHPGITSEEGYVTEILYAEELDTMDCYDTIVIYAGNEVVTTINEIERFL